MQKGGGGSQLTTQILPGPCSKYTIQWGCECASESLGRLIFQVSRRSGQTIGGRVQKTTI